MVLTILSRLLFQLFFYVGHSKRNQHFFGTGVALLELWEASRANLAKQSVPRNRRRQWQQQLDQLETETKDLRTSLVAVSCYRGMIGKHKFTPLLMSLTFSISNSLYFHDMIS